MLFHLSELVLIFLCRSVCVAAVAGIKMCKRKCLETKDCRAVMFDASSLDCSILMDQKNLPKNNTSLVIKRTEMQSSRDVRCPMLCSFGERCITNRREQHVCVRYDVDSGIENDHRLFILPYRQGSETTAFVFDPYTKEVVPYPFVWRRVLNGLYLKAERRLLLVLEHLLISTSEGTQSFAVLWRSIEVQQLSFDERIGMIFLISQDGNKLFLNRVNPLGKMKKRFHVNELLNVVSMDVDVRRKRLYVGMKGSIAILTYEGHYKGLNHFRYMYCPLYIDFVRNTVFAYEKNGTLVRMSMTGSKKVIATLKDGENKVTPTGTVKLSNSLYFSSFSRNGAIFAVLNLYEHPEFILLKQLNVDVNKLTLYFFLVLK